MACFFYTNCTLYLSLIWKNTFINSKGNQECPTLSECTTPCKYGRVKSLNNCELCECVDPCESVKCPTGHECAVENSTHICRLSKPVEIQPIKWPSFTKAFFIMNHFKLFDEKITPIMKILTQEFTLLLTL